MYVVWDLHYVGIFCSYVYIQMMLILLNNHPLLWSMFVVQSTCRVPLSRACRPYNLYCVGGDVKPCSINQPLSSVSINFIIAIYTRALYNVNVLVCNIFITILALLTHSA